jgi:hypothetical protein
MTMTVQLERRAGQRFDFNLPVSLGLANDRKGSGFTQNLSARGVFLCTDLLLSEADAVELTLAMPSEVTLTETMRVRCQGKILRVLSAGAEAKCFVAVYLEKYEYLPSEAVTAALSRIPAMPDQAAEDESAIIVR